MEVHKTWNPLANSYCLSDMNIAVLICLQYIVQAYSEGSWFHCIFFRGMRAYDKDTWFSF